MDYPERSPNGTPIDFGKPRDSGLTPISRILAKRSGDAENHSAPLVPGLKRARWLNSKWSRLSKSSASFVG